MVMAKTIKVGSDEFCSNCMEWREFDKEGKCKKCGKVIKKGCSSSKKDGYDQYKSETPSFEIEEENETDEFQ